MHTTIPRAFVFAVSFAVLCTAHAQPQKLRPGLWAVSYTHLTLPTTPYV